MLGLGQREDQEGSMWVGEEEAGYWGSEAAESWQATKGRNQDQAQTAFCNRSTR